MRPSRCTSAPSPSVSGTLGDAHPNTLQSRSYLIAAYEAAGQLEKAGILRGSPPAPEIKRPASDP